MAKVETKLPGPRSKDYLDISAKYEPICATQQAPLVWDRAQGVKVWDVDGNEYVDPTGGVLVGRVGLYGNVISIAPPLLINEQEAQQAVDIIEEVLKTL